MSVSGKDMCGCTVEANINPNASRTQVNHHAGSTGEPPRASFLHTFSVSTIKDLVERRRFNQVLKAVRVGTVGWWRVRGVSASHALFMLFLSFPNTLNGAQSVKDPQPLLEEQASIFYQPRLLFLLLMFFKHAQVHRSRSCPAGLVNLRGIPSPCHPPTCNWRPSTLCYTPVTVFWILRSPPRASPTSKVDMTLAGCQCGEARTSGTAPLHPPQINTSIHN